MKTKKFIASEAIEFHKSLFTEIHKETEKYIDSKKLKPCYFSSNWEERKEFDSFIDYLAILRVERTADYIKSLKE
jgi:hypothetical protein